MKLLLIEDNPADVRLFREMLKGSRADSFQVEQAGRLDAGLERLRQQVFDAVLLDLTLPDSQGLETLGAVQETADSLPIVVLTGLDDERFALEAVRAGAQDYLVKGRFDSELLLRTIRYAIQRKQAQEQIRRLNADLERRVAERTAELQSANEALRESEQRFRVAQELSPDGFLIFRPLRDRTGAVTDFLWIYENDAAARMNDTDPKEVCGKRVSEVLPHHAESAFHKAYKEVAETGEVRVVEDASYDRDTFRQRRWFRAAAVPTAGGDVAILVQDVTERRMADEALQTQRRLLETVVTHIPAGVLMVRGKDLRVQLVNPAYKAIAPGKEMVGKTLEEVWPELDAGVAGLFRRVLETGEPHHAVDELFEISRSANGPTETAYFSWSLFRVRLPGENGWGLLNTVWETTERKRAEEALRQSEQRFRTLADDMPQLAWVADPDGWIYWYNRRWYEYTGTTPEQMEGWGWQSVHDPKALPSVLERWKASIATGEPFDMVFPLRRADGIFRPFLTRVLPLKDEQGRVLQWFGTNTDVADQKATEEALRSERDFSTAIFDTAAVLIVVIDRQGRIVRINRACKAIIGYAPDEVCGRAFWGLLPPEDIPGVSKTWEALCSGKFPNQHENHWVAKDGSKRLMSWSNTALVGADGSIQYIIATGIDITERRMAEEALIRSEKLASVGRMAATIAHEVNNPLAAAINAVYIAITDPTASPRLRETLALADQELNRAAHITQQSLGFYRENGKRTPVALPKLIDEVLTVYAKKLQERRITLQTRYKCGPCREACDNCFIVNSGEMRQVISNLLGNGIDALRDSGRLHIRVSRVTNREGSGQDIHLTIADNGCGIRPENLKRIFEPFFTTKEHVGTGLGLWITQELVRNHNGSIRVRSSKGKGSAFRISIPAAPHTSSGSDRGNAALTHITPAAH